MKRLSTMFFTLAILASVTGEAIGQFTTNWERNTPPTDPSWMGSSSNTERSVSFGVVGGTRYLLAVRNASAIMPSTAVKVLNPNDGSEISNLDMTGYTGTGSFAISDAEISDDGKIFVCNMTGNNFHPFRLNMWSAINGTRTEVLNYPNPQDATRSNETFELGRVCTVVGDYSAGTAVAYVMNTKANATVDNRGVVLRFTQTGANSAFSNTPTVIRLSDNATTSNASVVPTGLGESDFYVNSNGVALKKYSSTGTLLGTVSNAIVPLVSNEIKFLGKNGSDEYLAVYTYSTAAAGTQRVSIVNVQGGNTSTVSLFGSTPTMSSFSNLNGTGGVDFEIRSDGLINIFMLATNNGIGSYTTTSALIPATYSATLTGSTGFRTLASPVANTALSSLLSGLWTQGFTGASTTSGTSNVYFHPNGTNTFVSATNMSNTISAGHGVLVAVYEDNDPSTAGVQGGFPKTLSVTGIANSGDVAVTPTHTSGDEYFLAGNPYNSTIDWDLVTKGSDVYSIAWVLKNDGEFDSWNGSVGDLTDGLIAPFQGFFYAYSGELSSVTFTEASKTSGGTFRGKDANPVAFRLVLGREGRENATWLQFAEDGTFGRDAKDAPKMTSLSSDVMQIATKELETGASMDIHYLPMITETLDLPLNIVANSGGAFSLSVEASTLPEGWSVMVRDAASGRVYNLTTERFEFETDEISSAQSRFTLIVEPNTSTSIETATELPDGIALEQNYPNPFNPTTRISYTMPVSGTAHLAVYDLLGREVAVLVNGPVAAGSQFVNFDASALSSGVYMYRLTAGGQTLTRKMTLMK
jgi:hypothetical protein